jgi:hypothetical protein
MAAVTPDDEKRLDDLLDDIHSKLDARINKKKKARKDTPTEKFDLKTLKRTKQAFAAMTEEEFSLEDSQDGIEPLPKKTVKKSGTTSIFGKLFGNGRPATA